MINISFIYTLNITFDEFQLLLFKHHGIMYYIFGVSITIATMFFNPFNNSTQISTVIPT